MGMPQDVRNSLLIIGCYIRLAKRASISTLLCFRQLRLERVIWKVIRGQTCDFERAHCKLLLHMVAVSNVPLGIKALSRGKIMMNVTHSYILFF